MSWQANWLIGPEPLKQLEQRAAQAGLPLIENAGTAIANWLQQHMLQADSAILIAAGQGNNGADALVAARILLQSGVNIRVWQPLPAASPECIKAVDLFIGAGGKIDNSPHAAQADILLDGIFGAGLHRPPSPPWVSILQQLDARNWLRVAIDVPSGLNAWTGNRSTALVRADHTLSLLAHKPGLYTADGPDACGKIHWLDIGCPAVLYPEKLGNIINAPLPVAPRKHNSHKGSYGTVHIIGGNRGMAGAAMLAARSAMVSGCGKARVHALDERLIFDPQWPELMLDSFVAGSTFDDETVGIGPGLGSDENAAGAMYTVMQHQGQLVIDADAINLLAQNPAWQNTLHHRKIPAILTPHPAEAARLLQTDTQAIQRDRLKAARKIASQFSAIVVLKGSGSLICAPDGKLAIIHAGNAALANAGQGDVLTGLICSLLAQGTDAWDAVCQACFLHANSANLYARDNPGLIGMTASTTIDLIRKQLATQ